MAKEAVIQRLKEDNTSCKKIYYKAAAADSKIGAATVYRMINMLEEIGVVTRQIRIADAFW